MAKRKPAGARRRSSAQRTARPRKSVRKAGARKTGRSARTSRASAGTRGKAKRRPAAKTAKKSRRAAARPTPRRATTTATTRRAGAARAAKAPARRAAVPTPKARTAPAKPPSPPQARPDPAARAAKPVARKVPALARERRTIQGDDIVPSPPSSLDLDRSASAVRTGRRELLQRFENHTETSPALTGGDVDADWESAYSVGDEAPGGDNPTPDQDIVDEIGRAVGVEYQDSEELKGEEKIARRDRHRWELDPASSEDYEDR